MNVRTAGALNATAPTATTGQRRAQPDRRQVTLTLLSTLLGAGAQAASAPAAVDLLSLPAAHTPRAATSLMLGVTRAGQRLVAVGERGIALWSDDEGRRWQQARTPVSVTLTALHFCDARYGWAVGHDGVVLRSTNGGQTWERRFDGARANALVLASAQARAAATRRSLGTLGPGPARAAAEKQVENATFALEDAQSAASFGPARPLFAVCFLSPEAGWVVGSYGQIFETRDAGATWKTLDDRLGNPERLHLNAILADASGHLMVAAEAGKLYRSEDGGQTWREQSTDYAGPLYGLIDLGSPGLRDLLAFGFAGTAFRSRDGGARWQAAAGEPHRRSLVAGQRLGDGTLVLLAQDGGLWRSTGDHQALVPVGRAALPRCAAMSELARPGAIAVAGLGGLVVVDSAAKKS